MLRDETWQFPHIVKDQIHPGCAEALGVSRATMARAGKAEGAHARRFRRDDPGRAVLDDEAARRRNFHLRRGMKEEIWRRFPPSDDRGAEKGGSEKFGKPGKAQ